MRDVKMREPWINHEPIAEDRLTDLTKHPTEVTPGFAARMASEILRLRKLVRYARHDARCVLVMNDYPEGSDEPFNPDRCSCGYTKVQKETGLR